MIPVETIEYGGGLYARIYHDADVEQPFADDDAVRIVVLHRRYIDPSHGACGCDPDAVATWERENADTWFTIPLFLYDHSGTAYRVGHSNPFHCPWDSGRVGIIALRRADWAAGNASDKALSEYAQSVAEAYTSWANGDCYGYVLHDRAGNEHGSCWGFIGLSGAAGGGSYGGARVPCRRCVMTFPRFLQTRPCRGAPQRQDHLVRCLRPRRPSRRSRCLLRQSPCPGC